MISRDIWIDFMFLNLIDKLTPVPPLFLSREGVKKIFYSPSLDKRRAAQIIHPILVDLICLPPEGGLGSTNYPPALVDIVCLSRRGMSFKHSDFLLVTTFSEILLFFCLKPIFNCR